MTLALLFLCCEVSVASLGGDVNAAIRRVSSSGGGRVCVPAGTWRTGAVRLASNVELHLEEGATLLFSDNPADYLPAVRTSWEGVECLNLSPLIYADGATNVAVTGKGLLRAEKETWTRWCERTPAQDEAVRQLYQWGNDGVPIGERDVTRMKDACLRPQFIGLHRCRGVRLEGFSLRDSPFWCIHLFDCEDVRVAGLDVAADFDHRFGQWNTDGVDIESCRRVTVEDCRFAQGDDVIAIKSGRGQDGVRRGRPSEDVVLRRIRATKGGAFLAIGSELSGGIRNVVMEDCAVDGYCANLLHLKTRPGNGGVVSRIVMRNVRARALDGAVVRLQARGASGTSFAEVCVEDVHADVAKRRLRIEADVRSPLRGLSLKNVTCGYAAAKDIVENCKETKESK